MEEKTASDDIDLLIAAQKGDLEAERVLLLRYKSSAISLCYGFYIPGGDKDDLHQLALIGLYEAIHSYKAEFQLSFWPFARICILRELKSAVKCANRLKSSFLNHYVSFDSSLFDNSKRTYSDFVSNPSDNPEKILITQEECCLIWNKAEEVLSPYMFSFFRLFIEGYDYSEIAKEMGCTAKKVANNMYIIRRKLNKSISETA